MHDTSKVKQSNFRMKNILLLLTFCWILRCTKALLESSTTNDNYNQTKEIPNHDVLVGGFPCQGFSRANVNKKEGDDRNNLYLHVIRFLDVKKPKYFCLENVRGARQGAKIE